MLAKAKLWFAIIGAGLLVVGALYFYFSYTGLQKTVAEQKDKIDSLDRENKGLKEEKRLANVNKELTDQSQVNLVNKGVDLTAKSDKEATRFGQEINQINDEYEAKKKELTDNTQLDKTQLQEELDKAQKVKEDKTSTARLKSLWNTYCLTQQCPAQ